MQWRDRTALPSPVRRTAKETVLNRTVPGGQYSGVVA